MVKTVVQSDFKVDLWKFTVGKSTKKKEEINPRTMFDGLKELIYDIRTDKQHFIIVDGLDTILTKREKQYQALASLILTADRINKKFKNNGINARLLLLCRVDLLDKLSDPNKNKIIQDSSILLDWYQNVQEIKSTNLYKLVNLRAKVSLKEDIDVFQKFLPHKIVNKVTSKYLLDYTRHTPRDVIQLLNKIQDSMPIGKNKPTEREVSNGVRLYSNDYFIGEIKDEMTGFVKSDELEKFFKIVGAMSESSFHKVELEQKAVQLGIDDVDFYTLFNLLYECGAIGNFDPLTKRFAFKYRNRHSNFNQTHQIVIHKGLHQALNLKPYNFSEIM